MLSIVFLNSSKLYLALWNLYLAVKGFLPEIFACLAPTYVSIIKFEINIVIPKLKVTALSQP